MSALLDKPMPTFDPEWNRIHYSRHWGTFPDQRVLAFMDKYFGALATRKTVRVLDLGTGVGAQSFALAERGYWVDGVDASEAAILRAMQRKAAECTACERINVSLGDITSLPYSDAVFDAAIDVAVLECLSWGHGRQAVGEMLRVLKPGGRFCSLTAADDYDVEGTESVGYVRTMTEQQISEFYRGFVEMFCNRSRHWDAMKRKVSWWFVIGRKPKIGE